MEIIATLTGVALLLTNLVLIYHTKRLNEIGIEQEKLITALKIQDQVNKVNSRLWELYAKEKIEKGDK